jgi:hypothetical protein
MENPNYPAWKHAMLYGLYLSIALIILSLIFYILDLYAESWVGFIGYAFLLTGVIISALHYRNKYMNGFIPYGKSVTVGFLTGLFASIIVAIFTFVFMSVLGDDYKQLLLNTAEERILSRNPDISDSDLDMAMGFSEKMMNPGMMSIMALLGYTFFSLVFALIGSIFIKKEEKI